MCVCVWLWAVWSLTVCSSDELSKLDWYNGGGWKRKYESKYVYESSIEKSE